MAYQVKKLKGHYLTGAALEQHYKDMGVVLEEFWARRKESGNLPKAELGLEDWADILGDDYPEWQMRTECVDAFVANKGYSFEEALARFNLTEDEYYFNKKRIAHGEGGVI